MRGRLPLLQGGALILIKFHIHLVVALMEHIIQQVQHSIHGSKFQAQHEQVTPLMVGQLVA